MRKDSVIEIRRATRTDVPGIVRLWRELVDHHRPFDPDLRRRPGGDRIFARWVREIVGSRKRLVLVARIGDRLVGYALVLIKNMPPPLRRLQFGAISDMCVIKAARRKGVGQSMLRALQAWLMGKGISRLEVGYLPANKHAFSFWHKMGFRPIRHTGVKWLGRRDRV